MCFADDQGAMHVTVGATPGKRSHAPGLVTLIGTSHQLNSSFWLVGARLTLDGLRLSSKAEWCSGPINANTLVPYQ